MWCKLNRLAMRNLLEGLIFRYCHFERADPESSIALTSSMSADHIGIFPIIDPVYDPTQHYGNSVSHPVQSKTEIMLSW